MFFPSHIKLTIEFPALDRLVNYLEQSQPDQQPEIDAITARLLGMKTKLAGALSTNRTKKEN